MPTPEPTTPNGHTIAGMYAAFGRGDVPHVVARLHPELEWIESDAPGTGLWTEALGLLSAA